MVVLTAVVSRCDAALLMNAMLRVLLHRYDTVLIMLLRLLLHHFPQALEYLARNLEMATRTQDLPAQAEACSNLGALHSRRGEHSKALEMFTRKYTITRACSSNSGTSSSSSSGAAHTAAAAAAAQSRASLTTAGTTAAAAAGSVIGSKSAGAAAAAAVTTTANVDMARCLLGLVQCNEMLEAYTGAVVGDLKGLLDWKCNRVRPGGAARK
jgi:Tetratricopeptide repeat